MSDSENPYNPTGIYIPISEKEEYDGQHDLARAIGKLVVHAVQLAESQAALVFFVDANDVPDSELATGLQDATAKANPRLAGKLVVGDNPFATALALMIGEIIEHTLTPDKVREMLADANEEMPFPERWN